MASIAVTTPELVINVAPKLTGACTSSNCDYLILGSHTIVKFTLTIRVIHEGFYINKRV
jgi:hypothetical protein